MKFSFEAYALKIVYIIYLQYCLNNFHSYNIHVHTLFVENLKLNPFKQKFTSKL